MGALRNMAIFSALPAAPLETLAREARYVMVDPGAPIIIEGEVGDSYYAITQGAVRVTKAGRDIRQMGPGTGFGEIALLYPVSRTASVTAAGPATLLRIERDAFLTAMRAHPTVSSTAGRVADAFLENAA